MVYTFSVWQTINKRHERVREALENDKKPSTATLQGEFMFNNLNWKTIFSKCPQQQKTHSCNGFRHVYITEICLQCAI